MWSTIEKVTSGVSLAAFLIAVVATCYRWWLGHCERQLRAVPPAARAALVREANSTFALSARNLSPDQAYELLLNHLRARSERFKQTIIFFVILALIASTVLIFAMTRPVAQLASVVPAPEHESSGEVLLRPSTSTPTETTSGTRGKREPITTPPDTNTAVDPIVTYNNQSHIYHCSTCSSALACTRNCTKIPLRDARSRGRACERCGGICKQT